MKLCLICLRTDRIVKLASNILKEFHDDLCDFSVVTMPLLSYYCSECEYLLTKFYKFKQKCVKALEVYQKWEEAGASKKLSVRLLYTMLPPPTLGMWTQNLDKTVNINVKVMDSDTDIHIEEVLMKDTDSKEIKLKDDQSQSTDFVKIADVLKIEYIPADEHKAVDIDEFINVKNDYEREEHVLLKNVDDLLKNESEEKNSTINVFKNESEDDTTTKSKRAPSKKNTARKTEKLKGKIVKSKKSSKQVTVKKNEKIKEVLLKSNKCPVKKIARKKVYERIEESDKQYESVFDIEYLTTHEKKLEEFEKRKTYESYLDAKHKCEVCYQVVKSSKFLQYHTDKWHTESPDKNLCPYCKTWNSKGSKHKSHHFAVFKCKLCPLITYHRTSMQNHFQQHKGKRYHCEPCNFTYKSKSAYNNHIGKAHRRGRNVCEGCGRGFNSPVGLAIHKKNSARCTVAQEGATSVDTEGVRCVECDVTLPSQQVYEAHVADVHEPRRNNGRPLAKNSAGIPESRVSKTKSRMYVRRLPAKHICRLCNKVGVSFGWLHLHFKREHPNEDLNSLYADKKTYLCDVCGAVFSNIYALRTHVNIHTGDRPYACDVCPKRFRSSNLMKEHRVRHFPSTVSCSYCGKRFKTKGNLCTHMKVHTGEKNNKCEICGKAFLYLANLNAHVQGVHFNIRRVRRGGNRESPGTEMPPKRGKRIYADTETDNSGDNSE